MASIQPMWESPRYRKALCTALSRGIIAGIPLLSACGGSAPQGSEAAQAPARLPIPPDLQAAVDAAEEIGRHLYVLDSASAIATDVLSQRVQRSDARNLAGYLPIQEAEPDGRPKDSVLVSFFTREEPLRIAYAVRVQRGAKPEFEAFSPPQRATAGFATLVQARQRALQAIAPARQPMNPVVLPGALVGTDGVVVYLLAGTTTPNVVVFGQHFRVTFSQDSSTPAVMPLTKTRMVQRLDAGPSGSTLSALFVSHLMTDYPLETHVFISLQFRLPVYVSTDRGLWEVDGDEISFVQERATRAAGG